ncbi:MAG: hypothetical protein EU547_06870 [Promethearchaeota archaeon]|nr:MAG: hypothetical protein EU547_06870 [Candidatus Lokiarchaeota archaeon]
MTNDTSSDQQIDKLEDVDLSQYPITTGAVVYPKLAILLQIILHCFSLLLPSVFILTFFESAMNSTFFHWRVLILFFDIFSWWGLYLLTNLIFGKILLILLRLFHQPKEGLFDVDFKNKDYYYFCLRISVKKVIFWIWNNFCFPWATNLAFKVCNMKADFKSTLFDGWSDLEFIEYGQNIMLGQGAMVASSMIIGDYLLIKKVIIGDHVVLGGNCIVAPGTIVGKNCTLGVWAVTHVNQVLEPDYIYLGRPARKFRSIEESKTLSRKQRNRRIVDTGEKVPFKIE